MREQLTDLALYSAPYRARSRELQSILVIDVDPKTHEAYMTGAEMLINQGFKQGYAQGFKQGQRAMLLRQLDKRFGKLSDSVNERIQTAESEQLMLWADRIFSAQTLSELFADP